MTATLERIRAGVLPVEGWTPSSDTAAVFRYVDISSVDRETKSVAGATKLPVAEAPSRARQLLRAHDVLVSTVRPNLNAVAMVPPELDGAVGSTGFTVLRANRKHLLPRYLFHWVRTPMFVADMVKKATGASYPAVSDRIVLDSCMPMPAVDVQRRIADILDKADAIRRKRKEAIALTEELLRSTFLEMFGDPVTNPKGWRTVPLEHLVDKERGISYGVVQRGPQVDDGVPIVRISNFGENRFDGTSVVCTSIDISNAYRRTLLRGGELVVSIRGTVGRVAIIPHTAAGWNVSREVAMVPLLPNVSRALVHRALLSDGVQRFILGNVKGVAQSGINLADLRQAPIPLPSSVEIARFERFVGAVDALEKKLITAAEDGETLFASLMYQAFLDGPASNAGETMGGAA